MLPIERFSDHVGRFAPSPTGALHAGSLATAVASYLDARAHGGKWLLRIEDLDPPRTVAGARDAIVTALHWHGLQHDGPVIVQSERGNHYAHALDRLVAAGHAYRCQCSRREIDTMAAADPRNRHLACPRGCRTHPPPASAACAWRLSVDDAGDAAITWQGRDDEHPTTRLLNDGIGNAVLRRRDGLWAYLLAVVVDDAASGVTCVVRGADLHEETAQQCHLQQLLGLPRPQYLHVPLVRSASGAKLSKQNLAVPIAIRPDSKLAIDALNAALAHLGQPGVSAGTLDGFWAQAIAAWRQRIADPLRWR